MRISASADHLKQAHRKVTKQRILNALDKIPESARASLPTIGRFYVEEAKYYTRPDGSQTEGILGLAASDANEIFLNRTNLSAVQMDFEVEASRYLGKKW